MSRYRFGPFVLDRDAYRLQRGDAPLSVAPKSLDLLLLFVTRPGTLVTKDDMLQTLWPGIAVTDNAITQVVSDLRQALGDDPASPTYVQTVPRRGYRFVATLEPSEAAPVVDASVPAASTPAAPAGLRRLIVMNFANVSGDASLDWLAAGIAETMTNDLRAMRELVVLDRVAAATASADPAAAPELVVVGSFQRSGDQLRLTARAVDGKSKAAIAHAKADGALAEVFQLQDALVADLMAALQLTITPAAAARMRARETSSLEAYRAVTEGRLKLETLEAAEIAGAAADFERALVLDPRYALAHVGLAHACYWRYQGSRARHQPDATARAMAIEHARRAIAIDADLAEAHASLALFLSSAEQPPEAVAEGRLAVALEPGNWRNHFRLGVAAWGDERLAAMRLVASAYPQMAYAYLATAMVHVARNDLALAEHALRQGLAFEDAASGAARLPGSGLHWLLGLSRLASGDAAGARAEFDRELALRGRGLFSGEYMMDAHGGNGFVRLATGDLSGAAGAFELALADYPDHARSLLGLAAVRHRQNRAQDARVAEGRARKVIADLAAQGRIADAAVATAATEVLAGDHAAALRTLSRLLAEAPAGIAGWTTPVEPLLAPLRTDPGFRGVLARLADRAK